MIFRIHRFAFFIAILHAAISKEFIDYDDDCRCVTSCFCSNHFCTPPRFPDFLGFFKSSLKNFENLANMTRDLSSKLIKRDCFTFAPLLRTDWNDFDRLVCSSLQSALEADVLLRMAVDETCSGLAIVDLDTSDHDSRKLMNLKHATLDFNIDNKKRRGGRENDDENDENRRDNDDDDDDIDKNFSLEDEMEPRLYGYRLVGMNFKINNSVDNRNWESSSSDDYLNPRKDDDVGGDDDTNIDTDGGDEDDGYENRYDGGEGRGLDKGGRTLMRSQKGILLTKQDISLVVILASILLSIILLSIIFYRIRKKQTTIPKQDIPSTMLASHPWYNGTPSFQEKETSFIEDRLTRNYKTHPVKRYL